MKRSVRSFVSVLLAVVLLIPSLSSTMAEEAPGGLVYRTYTESLEDIMNPERGFHPWTVFYDIAHFPQTVRDRGYTLAYFPVSLEQYKDRALDESFLATLNYQFGQIRTAGIKVIIRFMYDNTGSGEDAPLEIVLEHIDQLKPVLEQNADIIFVMQAGFVGAWGEGHTSSNNLNDSVSMNAINTAILAALPDNRMIQLRTPMYKASLFGSDEPLTAAEAFSGTDKARVGFHNDCFLANDSDAGTYGTVAAEVPFWKDYVAEDSKYTLVSGETCMVNLPRSGGQSALAEMERMHWTSLSAVWNTAVLQIWKDEGYFDEISRRMGYRFSLVKTGLPQEASVDQQFQVELDIKNSGFARLYNSRTLYLVFENEQKRYDIPLSDIDPRFWEPGTTTSIDASVQLPVDMEPGHYKVAIWLPDEADSIRNRPEFAIRLANDGVWQANKGYNVIADSLKILNSSIQTAPQWQDGILTAANVSQTGVTLSWSGASDLIGITQYRIYQGATLLDTVSGNHSTYAVSGLKANNSYTFRVEAGNAADLWSSDGPATNVTTLTSSPPIYTNPDPAGTGTPSKPEEPDGEQQGEQGPEESGGVPGNQSVLRLTDVPSSHWAAEAIQKAAGLGIVKGYSDGTFKPNRNVSRAEFVTMLVRALKLEGKASPLTFTDEIPVWLQPYAAQAVQAGIITGYPDGSFQFEREVTRTEAVVMVAKAMKLKADSYGEIPFSDANSIPFWAKPYVAAAYNAGLIQEKAGERFAPSSLMTRADTLAMLMMLLK